MELATHFTDFLDEVKIPESIKDALQQAHQELRNNITKEDFIDFEILTSFLQGSYRRHTGIKPSEDKHADIDVVIVTDIDTDKVSPVTALNKFVPFLEKYYDGKWQIQGRSIGIKLELVDLDLVVCALPPDSSREFVSIFGDMDFGDLNSVESFVKQLELRKLDDSWKEFPLLIPDREALIWAKTHPIAQYQATVDKNKFCNLYFLGVVRSVKWWKREVAQLEESPNSYPLERLCGECCPDGIESFAEGITRTLEELVSRYEHLVASGKKPFLPDYGVPSHDVLKRVTIEEFRTFLESVKDASELAREAFDESDANKSAKLWRKLLGEAFPYDEDNGGEEGGFTPRKDGPSIIKPSRFGKKLE